MKNTKYLKCFLLLMMISPWLSLPFMGRRSIKRFLPASLFISLIVTFEDVIAKKRRWWWWYESFHPKLSGIVPFVWGPFIVGSLWILKLTFGKFIKYIILNLIIDTMFIYFLVDWLRRLGFASLVRMKKYQLSLLFFFKSLLLYGFQILRDRKL